MIVVIAKIAETIAKMILILFLYNFNLSFLQNDNNGKLKVKYKMIRANTLTKSLGINSTSSVKST